MDLRTSWLARAALASSLLVACSGGGSGTKRPSPCDGAQLEGCGAACDDATPCPAGLYCEDAACTAECAPATVTVNCAEGATCSAEGRCEGGGSGLDGGTPGRDGSGGGGDDGDDGVCAEVSVRATVATPNVVLVIDQSGSMTANFGSGNRWTVLKDALLAENGLIAELQNVVRFGVALYTYDEAVDQTCPVITPGTLTVALNALPAIRDVYQPAEPGDNTPTGESIEAVLQSVQDEGLLGPDITDPTIFVLATDGNPDTCELPDQGEFGSANSLVATQRSVAAVKKAYDEGVRTYVIAVADENELAQTHVNDLANAGVGDPAGPGVKSAPSYRVNDDQGLRDALRSIVSGELSCDVRLSGRIVGNPCDGTVTLGGTALGCNDPNGWSLIDESTIRVEGTACDALKQGDSLSAKFPCDTVIVM